MSKYVWLIDTIYRAKRISYNDLNERWKDETDFSRGEELPKRTLKRWLDTIEVLFGIIIENEGRGEYRYYIDDDENLSTKGLRSWLYSTFSVSNALVSNKGIRDHILLEYVPTGQEYLQTIIDAMKENREIHITYYNPWKDEEFDLILQPLCVRLFRQRWYMLARSEDYDKPRVYSLDRIIDAHQSRQGLKRPKSFDAKSFFDNYFGIIIGTDRKPCEILLKVDESQVKYFDSLPLHESQRKVEVTNEYSTYSYHFAPTFDFEQEVLSHSPFVEVISPEYFRDEIRADLQKALERYD